MKNIISKIIEFINPSKDVSECLDDEMSFKESFELIGLPIVIFKCSSNYYFFMLDSGANGSIIDSRVLSKIEYSKTGKATNAVGIGGSIEGEYYINTTLEYRNKKFKSRFKVLKSTDTFDNLKKAIKIDISGIIGTEFLNKHKYILDFDTLIAYTK